MAIATYNGELIKIYNNNQYSLRASLPLSDEKIDFGRLTWSGDGKWLAVAPVSYGNGSLPIIKVKDDSLTQMTYVTLADIKSASFFNWTNRNIAVGNSHGEVYLWDIKEKKYTSKFTSKAVKSVDILTVNSDDTYLAGASLNQTKVLLYGLKTNKLVETLSIPNSENCSSLQFCMCKKNYLAASSFESAICVWDIVKSQQIFKNLSAHVGACTDVSFSPINYSVLASVGLTKMLKLFDIREKNQILDVKVGESIKCVDMISNGDKVALGTTSGLVIIYDLRASQTYYSFKAHDECVLSVKMQSLNLPQSYQDVDMNTPDQVVTKPKLLELSVIDILSPVSSTFEIKRQSINSNSQPSTSTPRVFSYNNSNSSNTYNDSLLAKIESPQAQQPITPSNMNSFTHSSPFSLLFGKTIKMETKDKLTTVNEDCNEDLVGTGCGDGHHINQTYVNPIIEDKLKIICSEISAIKSDMSAIKSDMKTLKKPNNEMKEIKELLLSLKEYVILTLKQEVYNGNCDSKLEHIALRLLLKQFNSNNDELHEKINQEMKLNALRLNYIKNMIDEIQNEQRNIKN